MPRKTLSFAVKPEGSYFVAQCLEYDFAVQGETTDELSSRILETIHAYERLAKEQGVEPFSHLKKPPAFFQQLRAQQQQHVRGRIAMPKPDATRNHECTLEGVELEFA